MMFCRMAPNGVWRGDKGDPGGHTDAGNILRELKSWRIAEISVNGKVATCDRSFVFQAEDGIRFRTVTGVQTCALPIYFPPGSRGVTRSVHSPQGLRGLTWNSHFPPGSCGVTRRVHSPRGSCGVTRSVHSPRRLDRSQLADLCRDVGRRDERLAHQHGVGSGHSHTLHLVAGKEPALADDDVARGNPGQQLERRLDPRLERRQVTVVDADDAGADG